MASEEPETIPVVEVAPARTDDVLNNPHQGFMHWGTNSYQSKPEDPATFTYLPDDPFNLGIRLYHVYVPWREIEPNDQDFRWDAFEQRRLLPILRNNPNATVVLRLVADYPNGPGNGITRLYGADDPHRDYPQFLETLGIRSEGYGEAFGRANCVQGSQGPGLTPDWNNPAMIAQMQELIRAFGARYDGDPRITAVQTGVLGLWGEGHQHDCPHDIAPGSVAKVAIRDTYEDAFARTPVQTRYPGNPEAVGVEYGFYEDYFPTFTVDCSEAVYRDAFDFTAADGIDYCNSEGNWNLYYAMANDTPGSFDNWKSNPISGESPLGQQQSFWINDTAAIRTALREYHFSFLGPAGPHGAYRDDQGNVQGIDPLVIAQMPSTERANPVPYIEKQMKLIERTLGYALHADHAAFPRRAVNGAAFPVTLELSNSGAAALHHDDYEARLSLVDGQGQAVWREGWSFPLLQILPGDAPGDAPTPVRATRDFTVNDVPAGDYSLRLSIVSRVQSRLDGLLARPTDLGIVLQSGPRDEMGRVILGTVTVSD